MGQGNGIETRATAEVLPPLHLLPSNTPLSERIVLDKLAELPAPWRVLHHLHVRPNSPGVKEREIDALLIHPERGLVLLEVKGGEVRFECGQWFSWSHDGIDHPIGDPYEQARSAVHHLFRVLKEHRDIPYMKHIELVVLPATLVDQDQFGANGPRSFTIDSDDMEDMSTRLDELCALHGLDRPISEEAIDEMVQLLVVPSAVKRRVANLIGPVTQQLAHLSRQQFMALDMLQFHRRVTITGGVGTGKTLLAIEKARRSARLGRRVLVTCFNRLLADELRAQLDGCDAITVDNFHGLAVSWLRDAGMHVPDKADKAWFEVAAPALLAKAARKLHRSFDTIIVDEAQDFLPEWDRTLEALLGDPEDGEMYRFLDPEQDVFDRYEGQASLEHVFPLTQNCRCTKQIARMAERVFGAHDVPGCEDCPDGPEPTLVAVDRHDDLMALVTNAVDEMTRRQGVKPDQLAILTTDRATMDAVAARGTLAGHPVWQADAGTSGITPPRPTGVIQIETVRRFKGLESQAVIVVSGDIDDLQHQRLLHIAISRAQVALTVLAPAAVVNKLAR